MTSNILIVLLLATALTALQPCQVKQNSINLYPSTKESFWWDLRENFFTGPLLTFSFSPSQSLFGIQKPIAQLQEPVAHFEDIDKVTAARALTETQQTSWRNHFVFIEQEGDTIDLFYSEAAQFETSTPPKFNKKIEVITGSTKLQCYSVDYIDIDTFLVDCADKSTLPFVNKFFIIKKDGHTILSENDNANLYTVTTKRITQMVTFTNKIGHEHKYYFRTTPAYATNLSNLDEQSILEVFLIDKDGLPLNTGSVLDAATIAYLIGVQDPQYFKLSIIDFKVFPNGRVYILDAYNGILVLELLGNGEWSLLQRIQLSVDQTYGFDVTYKLQSDGSTKELIFVLYNDYMVIYEDQEVITSYILSFFVSYPVTAAITQEFIIIQSRGVTYLYSSEHDEIYYKEAIEGAKAYLVNPYETEVIGITSIDSRRYTLSHGYLTFPSVSTKTTAMSTFQLLATDTNKNVCSVDINYRIIDITDYSIYDIEELILPAKIVDFPSPIEIHQLASGPNLDYTQLVTNDNNLGSSVNAQIVNIQELLIEDESLPLAKDVIYSDILALDTNVNVYYLLVQTSNLKVEIYKCELIEKYNRQSKCAEQDLFTAVVALSRSNFVWWTEFDQLHYIIVESDYVVSIYVNDEGQTQRVGQIKYPELPNNKITSITYLKNRFYLVMGTAKAIDIYEASPPFDRDFSITEVWVQKLGFTANWSPKRIFGNRSHNSYLFFIVNEDNVVLADFHVEITIIKTIACLKSAQIELAIGLDSFFIVQKTTTTSLIQEYDLQNISEVKLLKALPLYFYTLQSPLTTDFCSDTGDLFVRALDTKAQQTVVLIYTPMKLAREALIKVVSLGVKVADNKAMVMSTSGADQMFFYVNSGLVQRVYSYLKNPILILKPNYDDIKHYTKYNLKFQIQNYADSNTKTYTSYINLINTQIQLRVDQMVLEDIDFTATVGTQNYIDIGSTWFNGQAISLDIDCNQCDEYIDIWNPVQRLNLGSYNGYSIVDVQPYLTDNLLFLSTKRIILTDLSGKQLISYSVIISTNVSDKCEKVTSTPDGAYIFTACYINGNPVIHTLKCDLTTTIPECHAFGDPQFLDQTTKFSRIQAFQKQLFVLNSNPNSPKQQEGALNIFNINYGELQAKFVINKVIGTSFFNNKLTTYITSFSLEKYTISTAVYYKLFLVDAVQGLFLVDLSLPASGDLVIYSTFQQLDLYTYIISEGQYVEKSTLFQQIGIAKDGEYASSTYSITVLITTNNAAHYGLRLTMDASKVSTGSKIKTKALSFVLNQYGNWVSLNTLTVGNGFAVVTYTDQARVLSASYTLPEHQDGQTPLVRFKGGVLEYYGYPQVNEFIVYINKITSYPTLYANIHHDKTINENLVVSYRLYNNFQLIVLDSEKLVDREQILALTVQNTFSQSSGYTTLYLEDGPVTSFLS